MHGGQVQNLHYRLAHRFEEVNRSPFGVSEWIQWDLQRIYKNERTQHLEKIVWSCSNTPARSHIEWRQTIENMKRNTGQHEGLHSSTLSRKLSSYWAGTKVMTRVIRAVLPPTELARSTHKTAERLKEVILNILLCQRREYPALGSSENLKIKSRVYFYFYFCFINICVNKNPSLQTG